MDLSTRKTFAAIRELQFESKKHASSLDGRC
jgi:hypothetical protein